VELAAAGTVEAGGTTTLGITVRNVGAAGSFSLTTVVDTAGVSVSASPSLLTIPAGGSATSTLSVQAPVNATPGDPIVVTITGTSTADPGVTNSASVHLTVISPDVTPPVLTLPADITAEATSAAGAVVSYAALALDDIDGAVPVTCAPDTGATFALGTTTVSCSASDSRGNTSTGSFQVTVTPAASGDGMMFGAGRVDSGSTHQHFRFHVTRAGDRETGRVSYWVTPADRCDDDDAAGDAGPGSSAAARSDGKNGRGPTTAFDSTSVTGLVFSNDPAFAPGGRGTLEIDSVRFSGGGSLNGAPSYTFEAIATDRGEPGRSDTFSIIIRDEHGVVVANAAGVLKSGNVQSAGAGKDR
jgi:hypothetical protein